MLRSSMISEAECLCASAEVSSEILFNLGGLMSAVDLAYIKDRKTAVSDDWIGESLLAASFAANKEKTAPNTRLTEQSPGDFTAWEFALVLKQPELLAKTKFVYAPLNLPPDQAIELNKAAVVSTATRSP